MQLDKAVLQQKNGSTALLLKYKGFPVTKQRLPRPASLDEIRRWLCKEYKKGIQKFRLQLSGH